MRILPTIVLVLAIFSPIAIAEDEGCDIDCIHQRCYDYQIPFKQEIVEHECIPTTLSDGTTAWTMKYSYNNGFTLDTDCLQIKYKFGKVVTNEQGFQVFEATIEKTGNDVYISTLGDFLQTNITFDDIVNHCSLEENIEENYYEYTCRAAVEYWSADLDENLIQHTFSHDAILKFDMLHNAFMEVDVIPTSYFDEDCCPLSLEINLIIKQCMAPSTAPTTTDEVCLQVWDTNPDVIQRATIPTFRLELEDESILNTYQLSLVGVRIRFEDEKKITPNYTFYPHFGRDKKYYFSFDMSKNFDGQDGMYVEATVKLVRITERRRLIEKLNLRHLNINLEGQIESSNKLVKSDPVQFEISGNELPQQTQQKQEEQNQDEQYEQSELVLYCVVTGLGAIILSFILFIVYKKVSSKGAKNSTQKYEEKKQITA